MLTVLFWIYSALVGCSDIDSALRPKPVVAPVATHSSSDKKDTNKPNPVVAEAKSRVIVIVNATQTQIWIEGLEPFIYKGRPKLFWHESALIVYPSKEGLYRYYGSNGLKYYSPTLTAMAKTLDMLPTLPVEVTWSKKGPFFRPAIVAVPELKRMKRKGTGFGLPAIQSSPERKELKSIDLSFDPKGYPQKPAIVLTHEAADSLLKTAWLTDLKGLIGSPATLGSNRLVDLDQDGRNEAVFDVLGRKGKRGFVFDKQAGIRRYFPIQTLIKNTAFSYNEQTFVSGTIASVGGKRRQGLLYYDGSYRIKTLP